MLTGHLDVVKLLLKKGAYFNAKNNGGITALMKMSIMGHIKVVKLLLKEGANVDTFSNIRATILWLASGKGSTMKSKQRGVPCGGQNVPRGV